MVATKVDESVTRANSPKVLEHQELESIGATTTAVDFATEIPLQSECVVDSNDPVESVLLNSAKKEKRRLQQPQGGNAKKRPRVVFEAAEIVEFEPTLYTTSVTSGGVPLGMSFKERSRVRRRLDSFEMERKEERVGRQNYMEEGYLEPQEREVILNNAGCEEQTIAKVEEEVNQIIAYRRESNEADFAFMCIMGEADEEEGDEEGQVENECQERLEEDETAHSDSVVASDWSSEIFDSESLCNETDQSDVVAPSVISSTNLSASTTEKSSSGEKMDSSNVPKETETVLLSS